MGVEIKRLAVGVLKLFCIIIVGLFSVVLFPDEPKDEAVQSYKDCLKHNTPAACEQQAINQLKKSIKESESK